MRHRPANEKNRGDDEHDETAGASHAKGDGPSSTSRHRLERRARRWEGCAAALCALVLAHR